MLFKVDVEFDLLYCGDSTFRLSNLLVYNKAIGDNAL
jgi:hypothetical protein